MAQGVPGSLRTRIFLTFGTTKAVARQSYALAAFNHFQKLSRPQGTWFRREPRKKSQVTPPGIDPGTSRLIAQCLNHYATPGPNITMVSAVCDTSYVLCALLWDTESGNLIIRCMRALDLLYKVKSTWTAFKTSVRHSTK